MPCPPRITGHAVFLLVALSALRAHADDYVLFEAGQVRPLALADSGQTLYALNTPDDRLEIFQVQEKVLSRRGAVVVGMRPVSVAVRNRNEVWVVNHLSDSISIVDTTDPTKPYVARTLLVGDEPRDIVFAGPNRSRAFITTAHRGQNVPYNPLFAMPGVGRADVWVFDADKLGSSLKGEPIAILTLFADTPRALAVSPDGKTVYAAPLASGNETTVINQGTATVQNATNAAGETQPQTSLIAKFEAGFWHDSLNNDVSDAVNLSLPDFDVFTLDAMASPPVEVKGPGAPFRGVGTSIFNIAVNPRSGVLYVSNTEANNFTRFEGPGLFPDSNTTVRGNIAQSRITVISNGQVKPIHLNKHIDYSRCCAAPGNREAQLSLAAPREMVVSGDGKTLYVAAHGSSKVGVFDTAKLENNTFQPDTAAQIVLSGGGPTGLALDEPRERLYVLTQFNNAVTVVDTRTKRELKVLKMHTPEPRSVTRGRSFLYDALNTSSHGDSSCASCHIDGGMDHLAWDLGDPTLEQPLVPGTADNIEAAVQAPGTTAFAFTFPKCTEDNPVCTAESMYHFASLKGPMSTQTLRGLDNHGPMHWRGDRTGGTDTQPGAQPNTGMFDERIAFNAFNVAFPGLLGRSSQLSDKDMSAFTEFALQLMLPPNPVRNLDDSLTKEQEKGREIYFGGPDGTRLTDVFRPCVGCHKLDPEGNAQYGVPHPGFFGTDGRLADDGILQFFKVPQLRNAYDKVGMFGTAAPPNSPFTPLIGPGFTFQGDQVRGFGFNNDGALATVFDFLSAGGFSNFGAGAESLGNLPNPGGFVPHVPAGTYPEDPAELPPELAFLSGFNAPMFRDETGTQEKRAVEAFVLAFDTNFKPIVGQQVTLRPNAKPDTLARIDLLRAQAAIATPRPVCDLVAHGNFQGTSVGYFYNRKTQRFDSSRGETNLTDTTLRSRVASATQALTYTCVPPGSGQRQALDRDADGKLDGEDQNDDDQGRDG